MSVVYILWSGYPYDGTTDICAFSDKAVAEEYAKRMREHRAVMPEWDESMEYEEHDRLMDEWRKLSDFPEHAHEDEFGVSTVEARL